LVDEIISILIVAHDVRNRRNPISEGFECSLGYLGVAVFYAHQDASQDSLLHFLIEFEVGVFELLADESNREYGDFFDH